MLTRCTLTTDWWCSWIFFYLFFYFTIDVAGEIGFKCSVLCSNNRRLFEPLKRTVHIRVDTSGIINYGARRLSASSPLHHLALTARSCACVPGGGSKCHELEHIWSAHIYIYIFNLNFFCPCIINLVLCVLTRLARPLWSWLEKSKGSPPVSTVSMSMLSETTQTVSTGNGNKV